MGLLSKTGFKPVLSIRLFKLITMARLKGNVLFTGSLGNISAYTRKGSDAIILRTKGGASKERIKKAPEFANTRKANTEFGGASTTAKNIKLAMSGLTHLDHSLFQSKLNAICSSILKLDTAGVWGQRAILISHYRHLLEGFNLEMGTPFDSIVKHPLRCNINRADQSASIVVPALFPGIGLYIPGNFQFFRLIAVLGIVPDMNYDTKFNQYRPVNSAIQLKRADLYTDWFSSAAICNEQNLVLQIQGETGITDNDSLQLSIGIEFGVQVSAALINPVNYAGAAKILALA